MTPALVVVEGALVWSGLIGVGRAVAVLVAVEGALAVAAFGRGRSAVRRFRAGRASGEDGWTAAQDAFARVMPRPVARMITIEAMLWAGLLRWAGGRHDGRSPDAFGYSGGLRTLLAAVLGLTLVEGGVIEAVLALAVPHTPWPWIVLGLHAYALVWIAGVLVSLRTRPHLLEPRALRLRDSVFNEITIPYAAIVGARPMRRSSLGRSGLRVEPDGDTAMLAYGDSTVDLHLDPARPVDVATGPAPPALRVLRITVDDPAGFIAALDRRRASQAVCDA